MAPGADVRDSTGLHQTKNGGPGPAVFVSDGLPDEAGNDSLEPFPFRWNRNGALDSCFNAFSSREPVSTSLENALVIQERPQLERPRRVLQLAQRFRLDLADALSRDRKLLADLFQRVVGVHADAEAHAQHALFARRELGQHPRRGLAQIGLDGGVYW